MSESSDANGPFLKALRAKADRQTEGEVTAADAGSTFSFSLTNFLANTANCNQNWKKRGKTLELS